jgi:hypothetical protein
MKSWKTTTAGVLAIVAAIATALSASFDSDPLTVPNWEIVIAATLAGIGLIFARDNTVTSETAGAK